MERFRNYKRDKRYEDGFNQDSQYDIAYKKVKRIKGFYVHALVYVLVNAFIIISSFNRNLFNHEGFLNWETFSTALFWGIGLMAHGLSVFGKNILFGTNWEQKKIQEFMDKEKSQKWE
jgi:hypothetical protein